MCFSLDGKDIPLIITAVVLVFLVWFFLFHKRKGKKEEALANAPEHEKFISEFTLDEFPADPDVDTDA